ncbi:uncharacterized protein BXZ73DRAFT_51276 [Epithele typhae]|uniref:uncharacterized protein n=1 Tax=Epithele typhae TaxID=378194 RepID=UPI0020077876|nr:uncharacterized protein BXZ73DRAFT_51276 [Epithele typhae]KAH9922811.1 hypothetical protein BXZ73DRAFT_51276 [Epithele typhae]
MQLPISPVPSRSNDDGHDCSSAPARTRPPHTISKAEALLYYSGLPSSPKLLYRTGKEEWFPMHPDDDQFPADKEVLEVFGHPIAKLWKQGLCWKVVDVLDAHKILFTTIDVVRFNVIDVSPSSGVNPLSPVTIWIGVFPGSTSIDTARAASEDILTLLDAHEIADVNVEYRESTYTPKADSGPTLLAPVPVSSPLCYVLGPLTSALGVPIATPARDGVEGTMAVYLAEGGGKNRLLGLSCRHVFFGPEDGDVDYDVHTDDGPRRDVHLLGQAAFAKLERSVSSEIFHRNLSGQRLRDEFRMLAAGQTAERGLLQEKLGENTQAREALEALLARVRRGGLSSRVLGSVLRAPPLRFGVGEDRFTEDWAVFEVDRTTLGAGFRGNVLDIGGSYIGELHYMCRRCAGADNWYFRYPMETRLLPLTGVLSDELMHAPDMWDSRSGAPRLAAFKHGAASGTSIGRANGVLSLVRCYPDPDDTSVHRTSMEWAILNGGPQSQLFSEPGDSGAAAVDLRGRVGGMLTGGCGGPRRGRGGPDVTYATPFWWILERVRASGFPDAHLETAGDGYGG